jgi:hypothetical protein
MLNVQASYLLCLSLLIGNVGGQPIMDLLLQIHRKWLGNQIATLLIIGDIHSWVDFMITNIGDFDLIDCKTIGNFLQNQRDILLWASDIGVKIFSPFCRWKYFENGDIDDRCIPLPDCQKLMWLIRNVEDLPPGYAQSRVQVFQQIRYQKIDTMRFHRIQFQCTSPSAI